MPRFTDLEARLGQHFLLRDEQGSSCNGQLVSVRQRPALNRRFQCFAAYFALPMGRSLPQGIYFVTALDGPHASPLPLLLSPVGLEVDGRILLEAVFHLTDRAAAGQVSEADAGASAGQSITANGTSRNSI